MGKMKGYFEAYDNESSEYPENYPSPIAVKSTVSDQITSNDIGFGETHFLFGKLVFCDDGNGNVWDGLYDEDFE